MLLGAQFARPARGLSLSRRRMSPPQNVNKFEVRNDVQKVNLTMNIVETSNVETDHPLELPAAHCHPQYRRQDQDYEQDFMGRRDP